MSTSPGFDGAFVRQLDTLLRWRRDVRHFRRDPIPAAEFDTLLDLACLAPSVGYSQPWRFVLVDSPAARAAIRATFETCNQDALAQLQGERAALYARLKLAGLDDAPTHLAVFTDRGTATGAGLGRRTMPETLDYSTVAAVFSLWVAARARGIGVGWVSIIDPVRVADILAVPPSWHLTAYLCIGYAREHTQEPELAREGWEHRDALARAVTRR